MASAINPAYPVFRHPTTASVRANFAAAKAEIEYLAGYDLPIFIGCTPGADALLASIMLVRPVSFAANFAGARGRCGTNPAASYAMRVLFDIGAGPQVAGTITVATTGAFSFSLAEAVTLPAGAEIQIKGAVTADTAINDIRFTLMGESWPAVTP